jgi:esterase
VTRTEFRDNLKLSYLDAGGSGTVLIALHAHWMEATTYRDFAQALAPSWRVVALDQRGHGYSDHAQSYTREDYLSDLAALMDHLGIGQAVFLGNSLGGVNAYQFAARYPERVKALIIEDIGVALDIDSSFTLAWQGIFPAKSMLEARIGERLLPYIQESIRETPEGWRLAFDPLELISSQQLLNGNHWKDWLASDCPALLIRGSKSHLTTYRECEDMATKRPNTRLITLDGGHAVHQDNLDGFVIAVKEFLYALQTH